MTSNRHDHDDDLDVIDMQEAMETFVLDDAGTRRQYLRAQWIEEVLLQLVERRVSSGLTQQELGRRMDKPQSSIARLERNDDMKLSTLWDYLAATGVVPSGRIPVTNLAAEEDRLSRYVVGTGEKAPVLRVQHWRTDPLDPGHIDASSKGLHRMSAGGLEEPSEDAEGTSDEGEKVAVA